MRYLVIIVPFMRVDGIAVYPFILLRKEVFKRDNTLLRHETIHLRQQLELLILPFYLLYLANYLYNRFKYNHYQAYRQIIFEREAYAQERNQTYLQTRKCWAWAKY